MNAPVPEPLLHLYPYQRAWLEDERKFKVGVWSRQVGKTFASCAEIVRDLVLSWAAGKRTRWVILSRGERQAKEAMNEALKPLLKAFQAVYHELRWSEEDTIFTVHKKNGEVIQYSAVEVELPNGSKVTALPATPDTARGFSANVLLDEFAFHRDSRAIWTALLPVISRPGLKMRVISTPNGKGNKFYELATSAAGWSRHRVTIHDAAAAGCPRNIEELRQALGDEEMWRQEFECEFIDEATAWLSYDLIDGCEHPAAGDREAYGGGAVYLGNDIAARRDLFTLAALESVGDVLWCRELLAERRMLFQRQYEERHRWMERYRVAKLAIDQTGMGEETVERETRRYGRTIVEGVLFNPAIKLQLATALKERMEERRLRIPVDRELREDLHSIRKVVGPTGAPRIDFDGAETDGHGDRFWALALACGAAQGGSSTAEGWMSLPLGAPPPRSSSPWGEDDLDDSAAARWHQGAW